jgi:hypothetical protein
MSKDTEAPKGHFWVCVACGKYSRDRHVGTHGRGWDVSCAINAHLIQEDHLVFNEDKSRVTEVSNRSET